MSGNVQTSAIMSAGMRVLRETLVLEQLKQKFL